MSNETLPKFVELRRLAEKGVCLEGNIELALFDRLKDCLVDTTGHVKVLLNFSRDDENRRVVFGHAEADVLLECQRCLSPMSSHLKADISLALVNDELAAKQLPKRYDPLILDHDQVSISLVELIEEELLLSFSEFQMHEDEQCNLNTQYTIPTNKEDPADQDKKDNPFSILASLKLDQK